MSYIKKTEEDIVKKKLLVTALIATMVLSMVACGGNGNGESTSNTTVNSEQTKEGLESQAESTENVEITMEALRNHPESPAEDFEYSITGDGVTIIGYLGDDVIVVLPEEIEGQKVLKISNNVFDGESGVRAVKLSNSIEYIAATFMENKDLQYVICGESLQTIGDGAFCMCTSLVEIQLNEGLEKIGEISFSECTSLKKLYVPETVTDISSISFGMMSEDFTIQGKTGSTAEEVASSKGYGFEAVE